MANSMTHCNGHVMAAIDVETTGLKAYHHDIVQVCVLPLDANLEPIKNVIPFYTEMKPKRPQNTDMKAMAVNKLDYYKILETGLDADRVADLFDEWYLKLKLPLNKKLIPLAHNWIFDQQFLTDWLGYEHMQNYFFGHYRDLMMAAAWENDKADFFNEQTPYPKLGLSYIASQLKIERGTSHDSLSDCLTTARCYQKMLRQGFITQRLESE